MKLKNLTLLLLLLAATTIAAYGKGWRGIEPLRSTCEDVKRALKVNQCISPISEYHLPDFRVFVFFSEDECCKNPRDYRILLGTVIQIVISPTKATLPSELELNLTNYKKRTDSDVVGEVHYQNSEEGISVNLFNGFVQEILLYPSANDEKLRCKPSKKHD